MQATVRWQRQRAGGGDSYLSVVHSEQNENWHMLHSRRQVPQTPARQCAHDTTSRGALDLQTLHFGVDGFAGSWDAAATMALAAGGDAELHPGVTLSGPSCIWSWELRLLLPLCACIMTSKAFAAPRHDQLEEHYVGCSKAGTAGLGIPG